MKLSTTLVSAVLASVAIAGPVAQGPSGNPSPSPLPFTPRFSGGPSPSSAPLSSTAPTLPFVPPSSATAPSSSASLASPDDQTAVAPTPPPSLLFGGPTPQRTSQISAAQPNAFFGPSPRLGGPTPQSTPATFNSDTSVNGNPNPYDSNNDYGGSGSGRGGSQGSPQGNWGGSQGGSQGGWGGSQGGPQGGWSGGKKKPDNRPDHGGDHEWHRSPKTFYLQVLSDNPDLNKQLIKFEAYGPGNIAGVYLDSDEAPYKFTFENKTVRDHNPSSPGSRKEKRIIEARQLGNGRQGGDFGGDDPNGYGGSDNDNNYDNKNGWGGKKWGDNEWKHGHHNKDYLYQFWGYPAVPYGRYTDQLAFVRYTGDPFLHIQDVFRDGQNGFIGYPSPPVGLTIEPNLFESEGRRSGGLPGEEIEYGGDSQDTGRWVAVEKPGPECSWFVYWYDGQHGWSRRDDKGQNGWPWKKFEKIKLIAVDSDNVDYGFAPDYDDDNDFSRDDDGDNHGPGWSGNSNSNGNSHNNGNGNGNWNSPSNGNSNGNSHSNGNGQSWGGGPQ